MVNDEKRVRKIRRRTLLRRLLVAIGIGAGGIAVDYFAYPYGRYGARSFNRGENGLWLRYTWYFGEKTDGKKTPLSDTDYAELAGRLRREQIRYGYFHVRSIQRDGSLEYRFPLTARHLTTRLHDLTPDTKLLAWIYAGNRSGAGSVDLSKPDVRKKMLQEASWLVDECGFDGVQWDYEICSENEPGFLELLRETRSALPRGALLSVATPLNMPWPLGALGWSERYYGAVAHECDQICVMCYDSGMWLPRSYAWLVHRQAVRVSRAVQAGDPRCRLMLGIPTYEDRRGSHNPAAENIRIALKGVRDGLADTTARPEVFAGVALFADYTTDADEWHTYEDLWLR